MTRPEVVSSMWRIVKERGLIVSCSFNRLSQIVVSNCCLCTNISSTPTNRGLFIRILNRSSLPYATSSWKKSSVIHSLLAQIRDLTVNVFSGRKRFKMFGMMKHLKVRSMHFVCTCDYSTVVPCWKRETFKTVKERNCFGFRVTSRMRENERRM